MTVMTRPLAIVVGFIGKWPVAGMSLYNLHYIAGLQALGYDVHYVERQNVSGECYDPEANAVTDDPAYALGYLGKLLPRFGIPRERFSFLDRREHCHGSGWGALRAALGRADFLLALADPTWSPEFERCPRRAFVDGDPLFTQVALVQGEEPLATALKHYDTLFTYGVRLGMPDCPIPAGGRAWLPTRPVVATALWDPTPAAGPLPVTALMNWAAWTDVTYQGRVYGHKNREFERFLDLPRRTARPFTLAVGGPAPKERLRAHGWRLVDPLAVTGTVEAYAAFIAGSRADLGIAKHAYVASRSGWFSDRSTCYLAAGRPVLHQDTGCGDWLPAGEGVLLFSDAEGALEALDRLDADYQRHARAARRVAEEHFEAATVVRRLLEDAGFR
jgi:hypothetical protein